MPGEENGNGSAIVEAPVQSTTTPSAASIPATSLAVASKQETISDTTFSPFSVQSGAMFDLAQRMALALSSSTLVPAQYFGKDKVGNCLIAMEYASRLEVGVLALMQNLHIIQGKPSLSSSFLIGTVNASRRFTPLRFEFAGEPGTDGWACRCIAKDRSTGEVCAGTWITWLMVTREGWSRKNGSKWLTMPEQMFRYRAAAFWTRVFCPEISLGFRSTDELEDITGVDATALPTELAPHGADALAAVIGLQRGASPIDVSGESNEAPSEPAAATTEEPKVDATPAGKEPAGNGELPLGQPTPTRSKR